VHGEGVERRHAHSRGQQDQLPGAILWKHRAARRCPKGDLVIDVKLAQVAGDLAVRHHADEQLEAPLTAGRGKEAVRAPAVAEASGGVFDADELPGEERERPIVRHAEVDSHRAG